MADKSMVAPTRSGFVDVEYRDVGVRYPGESRFALRNIGLHIKGGEVLGLVGPSGSGKTTLLRFTAGFIKGNNRREWGRWFRTGVEGSTKGSLSFNGSDVSMLPPQQRNIAMVRQTWDLLPHQTVRAALMLPLRLRGLSMREAAGVAFEVMESLHISQIENKRPHQLSGGEIQRVALGRLLVRRDASMYLLDECLSSLDPGLRLELLALIRRLLRQRPVTTIWVTHLVDELWYIADRVAVISEGEILQVGALRELVECPASLPVFKLLAGQSPDYLADVVCRDRQTFMGGEAVDLPTPVDYVGPAVVAVRQGAWRISDEGGFPGRVVKSSTLSNSIFSVTVSLDGWLADLVTVHHLSEDELVRCAPAADGVFYFHPNSGRRLATLLKANPAS